MALVIANAHYQNGGSLRNPINDAQLVADSLRADGFDSVDLRQELTRVEFEGALRDFKARASTADIAVIYYAGHGIEEAGKNWMIPVDAALEGPDDLPVHAMDLDRIMNAIRFAKVRMVILDACRNNPFSRSWVSKTRGETSAGLGVSQLDDYVVIYAAAPGQTAADGSGENSPFATSLSQRLKQSDLPIQLLGNAVRDDVMRATGGAQRPFVSASITSTLVFLAPSLGGHEGGVQNSVELLAWQDAQRANTGAAYAAYLEQFPRGQYIKLADANVKRLGSEPQLASDSGLSRRLTPDREPLATAQLNDSVVAYNDKIAQKHTADMDEYRKQIAELNETSKSLYDSYQKKVDDFKAEEGRWRDRVAACKKNDAKRCASAADTTNAVAVEKDKPVTWDEGVVVCIVPADAQSMTSRCEGPVASGSAILGTADGDRLVAKACGDRDGVHDLGHVAGKHVFGCGYGLHPDDKDGKRKGNRDLALKFGLPPIPGRSAFHCTRATTSFCRAI
nr:caspase family protein [Sphingomonas sp. BIUV-7]